MNTDDPRSRSGEADTEARELAEWLQEKFQELGQYAYAQGLIPEDADGEVMWTLPHQLILGKVWSRADRSHAFWVIVGDVPTDHLEERAAPDPRQAAVRFARKWQGQATRIAAMSDDERRQGADPDVDWLRVGEHLAASAGSLEALARRDELWMPG